MDAFQGDQIRQGDTFDWVIVGAGIVGLGIAGELVKRYPNDSIVILEKEPEPGRHASGRNSGVLHAGIYYAPDSLKAKLCVKGARMMTAYCDEHSLPISKVGKIILPATEEEVPELDRLYSNASENGVKTEIIDAQQIKELEPYASLVAGKALLSPATSVVDSKSIVLHIAQSLRSKGVKIVVNAPVYAFDVKTKRVRAGMEWISYGKMINCAGAYADRVAHEYGVGLDCKMLPFRGSYFQVSPKSSIKVTRNIYPVPDKRMPFLGVHFTPSVSGNIYMGPTSWPALGREHYQGSVGIDYAELTPIGFTLLQQYMANQQGFRNLVHNEVKRLSKGGVVKSAQRLVPSIKSEDVISCAKRGIRAQLVDLKKHVMVMDFRVDRGEDSVHVLNAVSPAFTCGFSFASFVVDEYITN